MPVWLHFIVDIIAYLGVFSIFAIGMSVLANVFLPGKEDIEYREECERRDREREPGDHIECVGDEKDPEGEDESE